jgi:glycosyltransferase involved in cell wall biosynthesis
MPAESQMTNRRIVHVPRRFVAEEWGGTETVILEISKFQKQNGWLPEIFTSMALAGAEGEIMSGIPVRRYPYCYPFFGLSAAQKAALDKKGGNLLSLSLFFALLAAKDIRLFHAHTGNRLGGEVRTAARLRNLPFVISLHGGSFDIPASEVELMTRPISGKFEWGKAFGALFGSRRVLEDADHIICVGESEYNLASKKLGHGRISYLPNGVDPEKFKTGDRAGFRRKHGIGENDFLIGNISRIDSQKNQLLLLRAFAELIGRNPASRLMLIGPETQPGYAEELRSFVRDNGLAGNVTFLPGIRNDDPTLVDAYHAFDAFALTSVHEPFGIVVLEAWSSGKPVVVSSVGGLKSLVREGETGFFIDPTATDAAWLLAARLEALASDPDLRQRLGSRGLEEVHARYDWKAVGRQLESIYQAAEEHRHVKRRA